MPKYNYRVHNVPGQILSQVPAAAKPERSEDINKTLKEDTFKESSGCKKSKVSKGCTKTTKVNNCKGTKCTNKITSLDELRMKYSKI